ncbi:drosomycin-like [Vespula squamosa]|uniref:Drosomycin-like n=1 Tax=Vespula squamosa TaxID=30214 RepID=A0ABD2APY4_VESSQ
MDTGHPYEYIRTCKKSKRHDLTPVGLQQSIKMAKIYFLAFLALLVFVAVSAQEEQEQEKGTVLDVQLQNPEEYGWPCSAGGNSACNKFCRSLRRRLGQSIEMAKIYFLAFVALLVFVAVSAEEAIPNEQLGNAEEFGWSCSVGGNSLCSTSCLIQGRRKGGYCNSAGTCICY